jgi:two-component system, OmpR family, response regulator
LNILAIDDHTDTTDALTDYCSIQRIGCKVVNEGQKGLSEIQKREYDLIILDIAMPGFTGLDILRQLKKQGVRHETIVVLTGWDLNDEDFKDYRDVGVKEIIKKPIGVDRLDDIVRTYLINVRQVNSTNILSVH